METMNKWHFQEYNQVSSGVYEYLARTSQRTQRDSLERPINAVYKHNRRLC